MKAQLHPDETGRLAALRGYDILDSIAEPDLDEIVRIVSEVCGMPVSLVSLVDKDRQWFKAKVGLQIDETPIEASVCAHGILQPELLEIPDLTKDFRTIDNPIVKGDPNFRFYAGAALTNKEGFPLGMLCVLDYQPRELTKAQRDLLQLMAKLVMNQIELTRALRDEQISRKMAQAVLEDAKKLLAQNETLHKEVDHRVKNSLHQVAAFLRIQERRYPGEPKITEVLAEARNRVLTVASVHEHLHRTAKVDIVSVALFLEDLASSISQNRPPELKSISVDADGTRLSSDKIMTLGLAVNELISNAMKHAFRAGADGVIRVGFKTVGEDGFLRVSDNGTGLPDGFDPAASKGIGLRILGSLANQLGGALTHETSAAGTTFKIQFPLADRA